MQNAIPSPLAGGLLTLAVEAGRAIMAAYASGGAEIRCKSDSTPVTAADLAAEEIILAGLRTLAPQVPVLSEESAATRFSGPLGNRFFLVDPLDGTREFLARNGEFTVNIALIENALPVCGVVFAPALPRLFWAETSKGAFEASLTAEGAVADAVRQRLRAPSLPTARLRAIASRTHRDALTDEWLKSHDIAELVCAGSSLKFCLIAAGEADVYPRFGRTMEWDTAAGHAILAAAGGKVLTGDSTPLTYGKAASGFANPAFIASGP
jgi:3'(2'), 5'-bisphosphate nucleotidase